jgi:hypothetical protein
MKRYPVNRIVGLAMAVVLLSGGSVVLPGCLPHPVVTGGKVMVDVRILAEPGPAEENKASESVRDKANDWGVLHTKRPGRTIVIPFYDDYPQEHNIFAARVISNSLGTIEFPGRVHVAFWAHGTPFFTGTPSNAETPGLLVFSEGSWMAYVSRTRDGCLSRLVMKGDSPDIAVPEAAYGVARVWLYPHSRPWDTAVAASAHMAPPLGLTMESYITDLFSALCKAVDESKELTQADRLVVYRGLLEAMDNSGVAAHTQDSHMVETRKTLLEKTGGKP